MVCGNLQVQQHTVAQHQSDDDGQRLERKKHTSQCLSGCLPVDLSFPHTAISLFTDLCGGWRQERHPAVKTLLH